MQDICSGSTTLDSFRMVVFVGGFSYADVLGSAKGMKMSVSELTLDSYLKLIGYIYIFLMMCNSAKKTLFPHFPQAGLPL